MTETPTCPHCGFRLPPVSDAFCSECGVRLDESDEPPAKAERPATVVSHQEIAARRQTRVMLGTMFGFLAGLMLSWGCCGMTALSVFFAMHPPEHRAQYVQIAIGIAITTLTTWAGRAMAKNAGADDATRPSASD